MTPTPTPTPTPRTDARTVRAYYTSWDRGTHDADEESNPNGKYVDADFARELEREIADLREALPPAEKLRLLADFADEIDARLGYTGNECQRDLRAWADKIDVVLSSEDRVPCFECDGTYNPATAEGILTCSKCGDQVWREPQEDDLTSDSPTPESA